jgi:DNA ligase-1
VLLIDVATTSVDVGGSASRLAKTARIAELLRTATSDPTLVAIVVAWLSGELLCGRCRLPRRNRA